VNSFEQSLFVLGMQDATFFASDLFMEAFRTAFPTPPHRPVDAAPSSGPWRQYVAFYKWPDSTIQAVAFANFIRYRDVYLEGGLCARRHFYRRLPPEHWRECRKQGGVVQMLLTQAAKELDDATAWFGYCGDAKSWLVNERIGYRHTRHPRLKVKWYRELPDDKQRELENDIAALGPF
jgi:hypothetical protein